MIQQLPTPLTASPVLNLLTTNATKKQTPTANAATGGGSAGSLTSSSTDSIGSTFLSLLVQELQNQDPTDPMDSTAMVGQMISLNQLDQLISINQTLGGSTGTLNGAASGGGAASALLASRGAHVQSPQTVSLPFNPAASATQPSFPG